MNINPETLLEETDEEKNERQQQTGVIGNGLFVFCVPNYDEPNSYEVRHKAVCLTRPYNACSTCPHANFTLYFSNNKERKLKIVACPKWKNENERLTNCLPIYYTNTELATCINKPFDACVNCPSIDDLKDDYNIDKSKDGWVEKLNRLKAEKYD